MFEDLDSVVHTFVNSHLSPALHRLGTAPVPQLKYISYCRSRTDRRERDPHDIAVETKEWIEDLADGLHKAVLLVDLAPDLSQTPDWGYGLRVIRELAQTVFELETRAFLSLPNVLVSVMSSVPEKMHRSIPREWPNVDVEVINGDEYYWLGGEGAAAEPIETQKNRLNIVEFPSRSGKDFAATSKAILDEISTTEPRILVCDRARHGRQIAELIGLWI
jgi:hypothetical protein